MARVVLAMSGGVDSSVAAWLLREAGHDVIGLFMRHGRAVEAPCSTARPEQAPLPILSSAGSHKQGCCSAADAADARRVADLLDIPFYALNFEAEFGRIMDYFVDEYAHGRTPNPCVVCNNWLKFGRLLDYADSVGADFVATGHYARLARSPCGGPPELLCGLDAAKDQSYVLFGIERRLLDRVLFPVGDYRKDEIRQLAHRLRLRVADKKDSQEICFVPDGDYAAFVAARLGDEDRSGELVTTHGEVVGRHAGIEHFTIGQRKRLGVALGERRFVVRLEPETRRVVIGGKQDLARQQFSARQVNWLIDAPAGPIRCEVKIRYHCEPLPATVRPLDEQRLAVEMDTAKHGVAPGQAVVCYQGQRVLGGGWIE